MAWWMVQPPLGKGFPGLGSSPDHNVEQPWDCSKLNWMRTARGGRQEVERKQNLTNKWSGRLISSAWIRQGAHSVPFSVILGLDCGCIHCLRVFENLIRAVWGTTGTETVWKTTTITKQFIWNKTLVDLTRCLLSTGTLWTTAIFLNFLINHKQTVLAPRANFDKS